MEFDILQWIGYAASGVIALSMTMSSIVKFRWINLIGAATFATYGLLISAFPVFALNGFIVAVDVYYLFKVYTKEHLFDTLEIRGDNKYLQKFLDFHGEDIEKHFPGFVHKPETNTISFFVLRNMAVAGIFLAHRENSEAIRVDLDYVVPEYRDFKNGKFVYHRLRDFFARKGYGKVISYGGARKHISYLKHLGFKEESENMFVKTL